MNLSFLTQKLGGLPVWAWGLLVAGTGVAVWFFIRKQGGGATLGSSQQPNDPNIDPNTGVPYSIEEAINPATGLPAYYGGPGVDPNIAPTPPPTQPPGDQPPIQPTPPPVQMPPQQPPISPAPQPPAQQPPSPLPGPTPPPTQPPPGLRPPPAQQPPGRIRPVPGQRGSAAPGNGPTGGSCPLGLGCSTCSGHCSTQATPHWPVMTDLGVN